MGNTPAFSPGLESSTQRQIVMRECATEPYNPHLPGQAMDEGGNDGGMERRRERKGGRMMEWLLNIQQAVKSMQGVVGRLHYGGASVLHLFVSFSFYFSSTASGQCLVCCPVFQSFYCHSFPDIPSFFLQTPLHFLSFVFPPVVISATLRWVPSFLLFILTCFYPF